MSFPDDKKLDNPVWHSLSESHRDFAIDYKNIKFYHPDYCPFGGFEIPNDISDSIDAYSLLADSFFIVGEKPVLSDKLLLKNELICAQMIVSGKIQVEYKNAIVPLTQKDTKVLFDLVNLVQPGYFKEKTSLLGDYYGIFEEGQLVAVTGERMKMDDFVEISAVVTHPEHTGKGLAKQLVAHTANAIIKEGKTPYLHVVESNVGAIKLYEKLGFTTRRKISFWHIAKLTT
ncbi:ribosomal protein S18 acetylase RimI-like enzyme [Flavobacterium sp. 28YEA47A]|uniref:GNAT family N-acetyltransferase n=1 Tax=Flavobacterium sp. 28YEA47A TaxID=3156276 RepID=UPI003511E037